MFDGLMLGIQLMALLGLSHFFVKVPSKLLVITTSLLKTFLSFLPVYCVTSWAKDAPIDMGSVIIDAFVLAVAAVVVMVVIKLVSSHFDVDVKK